VHPLRALTQELQRKESGGPCHADFYERPLGAEVVPWAMEHPQSAKRESERWDLKNRTDPTAVPKEHRQTSEREQTDRRKRKGSGREQLP
jgi:hypothetical protein